MGADPAVSACGFRQLAAELVVLASIAVAPSARLRVTVQTLAVMTAIAGTALVFAAQQLLCPAQRRAVNDTAVACDPGLTKPASSAASLAASSALDACERGYSSVQSLAGFDAEVYAAERDRAHAECVALLGAEAPACALEQVPPLELAVCLAEQHEFGVGQARRVSVYFDGDKQRYRFVVDGRVEL